MKKSEKKLLASVEKHTTTEEKNLLDKLLRPDEEYLTEEKRDLKIKRYKLTLLKMQTLPVEELALEVMDASVEKPGAVTEMALEEHDGVY